MKRITDFLLATVGLLVMSPVLMLLSIIIRFSTGQSPFYLQQRLGKDAVPFRIIKFKTMSDALDPEGNLLPDAQRLNRMGKWLRNTSLDELPQFINVWKGEMSLVGPRPLLLG